MTLLDDTIRVHEQLEEVGIEERVDDRKRIVPAIEFSTSNWRLTTWSFSKGQFYRQAG